jgi:hypothetical protein
MTKCLTGTNVPTLLPTEPCGGEYLPTACIVNPGAISYLNLPANSTQQTINSALINALMAKDVTIFELESRILILENL